MRGGCLSVRSTAEPAGERDTDGLNRVFATRSPTGTPRRARGRARAALESSGVALRPARRRPGRHAVARRGGHVVAFNIAHRSAPRGGWDPSRCGRSPGRGGGEDHRPDGARLAARAERGDDGLETMPRTVENIGFYAPARLLPRPSHRDAHQRYRHAGASGPVVFVAAQGRGRRQAVEAARHLVARSLQATTSLARSCSPRSSASRTSLIDGNDGLTRWCCGTRRRSPRAAEGRGARPQARPRDPDSFRPRSRPPKPPRPAPGSGASPCAARPA